MSRISVLSEAVGKIQELENLVNHKNKEYSKKRIPYVLKELQDLRYANAMVGEEDIQKWYLSLIRKIAAQKVA